MRGLSARGPVTIVEDRWHVTEVTHYITSRFGAGACGGEPGSGTVRRLSAGYVAIRFDDPVFVVQAERPDELAQNVVRRQVP
jgi:hypothetical protein